MTEEDTLRSMVVRAVDEEAVSHCAVVHAAAHYVDYDDGNTVRVPIAAG